MFIKIERHSIGNEDNYTKYFDYYTIVDTDFIEEKIEAQSLWHAIIEVYSKKGLNAYANLAIAIKKYGDRYSNSALNLVLYYIRNSALYKDIDKEQLDKYLLLM